MAITGPNAVSFAVLRVPKRHLCKRRRDPARTSALAGPPPPAWNIRGTSGGTFRGTFVYHSGTEGVTCGTRMQAYAGVCRRMAGRRMQACVWVMLVATHMNRAPQSSESY